MNFLQIDINKKDTMEKFYEFYNEIITQSFDKNEYETISQFEKELKEKDNERKYYIIVVLDDFLNVLGGIVFDYFAKINVALIEYIATNKKQKRKGIASAILKYAVEILNKEARKSGNERIKYICGEVEKQINGKQDKHYFWNKYEFKRLDFKYIQPALDKKKKPVEIMDFGIMTKIPNAEFFEESIKTKELINILETYYEKEERANRILLKMKKEIESKGNNIYLIN